MIALRIILNARQNDAKSPPVAVMRARSEQLKIDYPRLTVVSSVQESFVNLWSAAIRPRMCVCVCNFRVRIGQFSHRLREKLHSPHISPKMCWQLKQIRCMLFAGQRPNQRDAEGDVTDGRAKVDLESQITELSKQ